MLGAYICLQAFFFANLLAKLVFNPIASYYLKSNVNSYFAFKTVPVSINCTVFCRLYRGLNLMVEIRMMLFIEINSFAIDHNKQI